MKIKRYHTHTHTHTHRGNELDFPTAVDSLQPINTNVTDAASSARA